MSNYYDYLKKTRIKEKESRMQNTETEAMIIFFRDKYKQIEKF